MREEGDSANAKNKVIGKSLLLARAGLSLRLDFYFNGGDPEIITMGLLGTKAYVDFERSCGVVECKIGWVG